MAFQAGFLRLMPDTITVTAYRRDSTGGYGGPTYTTASASYRARVVAVPTRVKGSTGQDVVATHTMWVATTADIGTRDKLSFGGSTFEIVEVARFPDQDGRHHSRLRCRGGV